MFKFDYKKYFISNKWIELNRIDKRSILILLVVYSEVKRSITIILNNQGYMCNLLNYLYY